MLFQPSQYSDYGQTVAPSSGTAGGFKAASTAASTTATVAKLGLLATGSGALGPAGWIAAGVLGAAAGTVVVISEIKKGKKNKAAAVKWAKQIGLPDPDEAARFIVKVATKDKKWRRKELAQQKRQIARKKGRRTTKGRTRRMDRDQWKIDVLTAYERYLKTGSVQGQTKTAQFKPSSSGQRRQIRQATGQAMPAAMPAPTGSSSTPLIILGVTSAVLIGGYIYSQRGR
jgi:hypothetical protein